MSTSAEPQTTSMACSPCACRSQQHSGHAASCESLRKWHRCWQQSRACHGCGANEKLTAAAHSASAASAARNSSIASAAARPRAACCSRGPETPRRAVLLPCMEGCRSLSVGESYPYTANCAALNSSLTCYIRLTHNGFGRGHTQLTRCTRATFSSVCGGIDTHPTSTYSLDCVCRQGKSHDLMCHRQTDLGCHSLKLQRH